MPISAQDLDRTITIERLDHDTVDAFNSPIVSWRSIGKERARRRDVSDTLKLEYLAAGQPGSFQMVRFTVRSNNRTRTLRPVDRLVCEGKIWNITGVKELDEGRHRFIEITVSRDADI